MAPDADAGLKLTSPFYLHPSDHPGLQICPIVLKGDNYNEWVTSIRNALVAKRKIGFIDGTVKEPAPTAPEYEHWLPVNSMLVGWIVQSIDPSLRSSITYFSTVKQLWDDLQQRFCVGNGPRILQLRTEITLCRQHGRSISDYFGTLKKLWDDLSTYVPMLTCECTGCKCGLHGKLTAARDDERTHQFLMGLDHDSYGTLRSNIMAQDPLPSLNRVYQLVIQEERLKSVVTTQPQDQVALAARPMTTGVSGSTSASYVDKKSLSCTHCGGTGHDTTTCFKIHGYPDWWYEKNGSTRPANEGRKSSSTATRDGTSSIGGRGRGRGQMNYAQSSLVATSSHAAAAQPTEQDRLAIGSSLTNDQWTSMLQMLKAINASSQSTSTPGPIPKDIGSLYNLKNISLHANLLEGPIPSSITNCTSLLQICASGNRLTGNLPKGLGELRNLTILSLANNSLSGSIPEDLFNCSMLKVLDLYENNFNGGLGPNIGTLLNLRHLDISGDSFSGKIPHEIGNLSQLTKLSLRGNYFTGSIPQELSKLSFLQGLELGGNSLEGAIPNELFKLTQLTILGLDQNNFVGPIPDAILNLQLLSYLDLSKNMLNGTIPKSMEKIRTLTTLDLSKNHLSGPIPPTVVASMKGLQIYLNLSYNFFEGTIPNEISKLEMVQVIDISNNNLSGSIPVTLQTCRNLITLDVSGNILSGNLLGETFSQMTELINLNLSRNQLEGEIPVSLSGLRHLYSLDFSHNKFSGLIPESLSNISSLKNLNLSFNQLQGPVPDKGIFRNISNSSLIGNPDLCGYLLSKACSHHLRKKTMIILLVIALVPILVFVVLVICIYQRFKSRKHIESGSTEPLFAATYPYIRYSMKDLEQMTDFFSDDNIIGSSNLSTVYKGKKEDDGQIVAIKILNLSQFSTKTEKYFDREAKTLSRLRHRNLVKVLGYAYESRKLYALILQYMDIGNLENIIHGSVLDKDKWTMTERIDVLISIANGLVYLHSGYDIPIVHCDLKPANVLLDTELVAHVSDFGTTRMLGIHLDSGGNIASSSAFEGTIGYLAPEFAYMRTITTKIDVFSFGVLIMELITKRRPTGLTDEKMAPITLSQLVQKSLENGIIGLQQVLDPQLVPHLFKKQEAIVGLLTLALSCTNTNPKDRPDMEEVLSSITKLKMISSRT